MGGGALYALGENNIAHENANVPFEIEFPTNDNYIIKEMYLIDTFRGMIIEYNGSNQLYLLWIGNSGTVSGNESQSND